MKIEKKEIEKFLNGKNSEQGEKLFNKWYDSFPTPEEEAEVDAQLLQKEVDRIKAGKSGKVIQLSTSWRKIAAVMLPLIISSALIYFNSARLLNLIDPIDYAKNEVPAGKRTQITLADGSTVWLNAGSSLRYPKDFKRNTREVYLSGEAFFDVARDEKKPFIVYTKNLAVRVLGTSFNIHAYPDQDKEEVTVVTGKVNVTSTRSADKLQSVNLIPGQRAICLSSKETTTISQYHTGTAGAVGMWRESKLLFDGMSVQEIVFTLQKHYDVSITLADSALRDQKVTAVFVDVMPLEKVLDLLNMTLNTCYTKEGKTYVLGASACRPDKKESH